MQPAGLFIWSQFLPADRHPSFVRARHLTQTHETLRFDLAAPFAAAGAMALIAGGSAGGLAEAIAAAVLIWNVFAVLHHSEVLARRAGQPLGTLVLTLAVTAVEVSVIFSVMLSGAENPTLAREAVFSTIMIVTTGVVGICLLRAGWNGRAAEHNSQATSAYLTVLITLAGLALVLPNYTVTTEAGTLSDGQLEYVAIAALLLYGSFLYIQTTLLKKDFVGEEEGPDGEKPENRRVVLSAVFLVLSLAAVVTLADAVAEPLEVFFASSGLADPEAVVGMFVAAVVLLPEGINAVRASNSRSSQQSLNIALGSALATIGLTIPAVIAGSFLTGQKLELGLGGSEQTLLVLALSVSMVSFGTGRTNVLTGLVHLVLFGAFVLTRFLP